MQKVPPDRYSRTTSVKPEGIDMTELQLLQTIRLKGRIRPEDLASAVGEHPAEVAIAVEAATVAGLLADGKAIRLSDDGRARLTELLAAERQDADHAAISAAYAEFRGLNQDFKGLVTEWQVKDGEPNNHDDEEYDSAVLARLVDVHQRITPIIATIAGQLPRLAAYAEKLSVAFSRVQGGDTTWLTRPIIDSYHTVWFELHEELILTRGLTRESEAKAGHGQ
jgi:hypothetical protein